jgi:hypothetical protein
MLSDSDAVIKFRGGSVTAGVLEPGTVETTDDLLRFVLGDLLLAHYDNFQEVLELHAVKLS